MNRRLNQGAEIEKPTRPCAKRDSRPADCLPANTPAESEPHVVAFEYNSDEFGVGTLSLRKKRRVLRVINCEPPIVANGQAWAWMLEEAEYAEGTNEPFRIVKQIVFKTKGEADAAFKHWKDAEITNAETGAIMQKGKTAQPATDAIKLSSGEQDLRNARLKVLREQYPDTFKAMDALAQAQPVARPGAVEAVLRAYVVDMVRLHKPAKLGAVSPFETMPDDASFILELAKAYSAKSPYDAVDHEIAARWFAAGYDKMSLAEYTRAINARTGANISPDAMKARRLKKLRLLSSNPEGAPIKSPNREN